MANWNPNGNIFATDKDGNAYYQSAFTNTPVNEGAPEGTPTDGNPIPQKPIGVDSSVQGVPSTINENNNLNNSEVEKTQAPVTPYEQLQQGIQEENDPSVYHEDNSNPAQSAMDYIVGPPSEESYKKASTNAKKLGLVADALRHIGNIINTTGYAPAQNIESTFDYLDKREKVQQAQRQKDAQLKAENDYKDWNKQYKLYQQAKQDQKDAMNQADKDRNYNLKQDQWNTMKPYWDEQANAAKSRAEKAGYDAAIAKIRAGSFKTQNDLDTFLKQQKIKLNDESMKKLQLEMQRITQQLNGTYKPTPSSGKSKSGGGRNSGGGKYVFRGKSYPNSTMYGKAVTEYAKSHGIPLDRDVTTGTGYNRKTYKKTRSIADLAAEGESHNGGSSRRTSSGKKIIKGFGGH